MRNAPAMCRSVWIEVGRARALLVDKGGGGDKEYAAVLVPEHIPPRSRGILRDELFSVEVAEVPLKAVPVLETWASRAVF